MQIEKISVTFARKFQTQQFESLDVGTTLWATLEEGEDPALALKTLWNTAKASCHEEARPILEKSGRIPKPQVQERFMNQPVEVANNSVK